MNKELEELKKIVDLNKADTGGGCSICNQTPVIFREGDLWLCHECVLEAMDDRGRLLEELAELRKEQQI